MQRRPLWKVPCTFFIAGVLSSLVFAWCVTRHSLQSIWFHSEEFWVFPTATFWLLAGGLFFLNLLASYLIAHLNEWVPFSPYRLVGGTLVLAVLPAAMWMTASMPPLSQFLIFRFLLAIVLSLMLYIITRKWHSGLALALLAVSLLASLIAGMPYAIFSSIPNEWFEASKFFVNSTFLSVLFGYWLAKSSD